MLSKPNQKNDINQTLEALSLIIDEHPFLLSIGNFISYLINISIKNKMNWSDYTKVLDSCIKILTIADETSDDLRKKTNGQNHHVCDDLIYSFNVVLYERQKNNVSIHHQFNRELLKLITLLIDNKINFNYRLNNKLIRYAVRYNAYDLFMSFLTYYSENKEELSRILNDYYFENSIKNLKTHQFYNDDHPIHRFIRAYKKDENFNLINNVLDTLDKLQTRNIPILPIQYGALSKLKQDAMLTFMLCLKRKKNEKKMSYNLPKPVVLYGIFKINKQSENLPALAIKYFANSYCPIKEKSKPESKGKQVNKKHCQIY